MWLSSIATHVTLSLSSVANVCMTQSLFSLPPLSVKMSEGLCMMIFLEGKHADKVAKL